MDNNELKAWLLLAGFRLYRKHVYVISYEGWYITVAFLYGRIDVGTLSGERCFYFPSRVQKYIQELIGDRYADIPSLSEF